MTSYKENIVHVYPKKHAHHLQRMVQNNEEVLFCYGNKNVIYASFWGAVRDTLLCLAEDGWNFSRTAQSRSGAIVFHSAHYPKSWLFILVMSVIFKKRIMVSWGGEFDPMRRRGAYWIIRNLALIRLSRIVFLSKSDRRKGGRSAKSVVIPYYNPSYLTNHRPPYVRQEFCVAQVGNSGEEANGHIECLDTLAGIAGLRAKIIIPAGYHLDKNYQRRLDVYLTHLPTKVSATIIDELLSADQFDALIDRCDCLLIASYRQRALYSIYRYLSAGKAVFIPAASDLFDDLTAEGFKVYPLELLRDIDAARFLDLVRAGNAQNVENAERMFGVMHIRNAWSKLMASV